MNDHCYGLSVVAIMLKSLNLIEKDFFENERHAFVFNDWWLW